LSCDPVSAFGGILATNSEIDEKTAVEINNLFFEVLIAPSYSEKAKEILSGKTNRIILQSKNPIQLKNPLTRTVLNGELVQERDTITDVKANMTVVTETTPTDAQFHDLEIAIKLVKQTKSNTIVLVKNGQLLASGTGQTSRVDALQQAIEKANRFGFELQGAVMASDAFFPFPDCVEIADKSGIQAVVQPGGSIKDQASVDYCNNNDMAMVITGVRHFKH
jgi:phosphoribosylaminoimidazolecarboxamide formyltransferase/IMP cyclohydrolase